MYIPFILINSMAICLSDCECTRCFGWIFLRGNGSLSLFLCSALGFMLILWGIGCACICYSRNGYARWLKSSDEFLFFLAWSINRIFMKWCSATLIFLNRRVQKKRYQIDTIFWNKKSKLKKKKKWREKSIISWDEFIQQRNCNP